MKLSLSWIFDYIDADWRTCDVQKLAILFNQKVAEIESFYPIKIAIDKLFIAEVAELNPDSVIGFVPELGISISLPVRDNQQQKQQFLVINKGGKWLYATGSDLYQEKNSELPAIYCAPELIKGAWKQTIDVDDYILEIDNKSITHRPDLWSHYGFAREIALLLQKPLKRLPIAGLPVVQTEKNTCSATNDFPFDIVITHPKEVKRFSAIYFDTIENKASIPWMASRLCRVESKPISALVDMTNYVMLDVGQPMHAFDAQMLNNPTMHIGNARYQDKLCLLDDECITLTDHDLVVSNGAIPVALAGIMGGKQTAVSAQTSSIFLEAANFDATRVRLSSAYHKKRTESSARFEKSLDPNQTVLALQRFVDLLERMNITYHASSIVSVGIIAQPVTIAIAHTYITEKIGVELDQVTIITICNALDFAVATEQKADGLYYNVTIASIRCTKDVRHKEDLLEEIVRVYGYTNVVFELPRKATKPSDITDLTIERNIKRQLSFGVQMREVKNYGFYQESFLQKLGWQSDDAVTIESPVSEEYRRLVTSLIPGLIANVTENHADHDKLRFFEWARTWAKTATDIVESCELAGIFYQKKNDISFYEIKTYVQDLCDMLHMPITWHKVDVPQDPWFAPHQTAHIMHDENIIGTVGKLNIGFTHHVLSGSLAVFSLNGGYLKKFRAPIKRFEHMHKYPSVARDVSMMVPLSVTVQRITDVIYAAAPLIRDVALIDFFEKREWGDHKSLAFRYILRDDSKTLGQEQVQQAVDAVAAALIALGAQIR